MKTWVPSPALALYVIIFYVGYQMLDGYLLTPLVQKRTVSLPPALIIISQGSMETAELSRRKDFRCRLPN